MTLTKNPPKISFFLLVLLITGSIDSIRNLPSAALFGSELPFFFILGALTFLLPTAFISAELSSRCPDHSGIYGWTRTAFGKKWAFLAIWLQWVNTMVWYPTILSFIAATTAHIFAPTLANNKLYMVSMILTIFWLMTFVNLKGLRTSARFASICTLIGTLLPMLMILILALIWVIKGNPSQVDFHHWVPNLHHQDGWISLTAIMASFLGMELATVHTRYVDKPRKTVPKALLTTVVIIAFTMLLGSLAIAMVLPGQEIALVDGIMQAFSRFLDHYHLAWAMPIIGILIVIGSLGSMINWMLSPATGLLQAAQDGFVPSFLAKTNKVKAPANLLILQAIVVSAVCSAFLLMPSISGSYWLLTALSTELYMLMYVMMFCAAIKIRYQQQEQTPEFIIPGKTVGFSLISLLGFIGCGITLFVGFIPPGNINTGNHYAIIFTTGLITMILPVILFYIYHRRTSTTPTAFMAKCS
ncbi:Glutamate/gamma-aminobutyrate antiporter [Piscirickettsia salmonis]|uniref:APC family permease n=1 Tax=Piscirickettsia salmonis TaxID=1238 RepID=UPI0012B91F0C|nr:APC family permease [Piscirickettsia salmonis]QGP48731.1 Glutamate/gamma-aminobutyrate antiporter [Piscirickettsia salmonis]